MGLGLSMTVDFAKKNQAVQRGQWANILGKGQRAAATINTDTNYKTHGFFSSEEKEKSTTTIMMSVDPLSDCWGDPTGNVRAWTVVVGSD